VEQHEKWEKNKVDRDEKLRKVREEKKHFLEK
jgi:hypothetical protein